MPLAIPAETTYSDEERRWLQNEPAGIFPTDQTGFYGQARKVFADYLQVNFRDMLDRWWNNLDPSTCSTEDLANWEVQLGIPVNLLKSDAARIAFIGSRRTKGAFTRTRRRLIVEAFIIATFGGAPSLTPDGLSLTGDGITLLSDATSVDGTYEIVEDIPGFSYDVRILESVGVDEAGLYRELYRITPSPIDDNFSISIVDTL